MWNPTVTIAIPFYNAEKYLESAIQSVCNQSYSNLYIILLDDGSTDKSLIIAKSFEIKDKRIRVYSDGQNKGLIYRLNQSVELCNTEYYARMDADDIMHPLRIEKQIDHIKNDSTIDVLGTSFYSLDSENNIRGCIEIPYIHDRNHLFILHPSVIAKTEWFRKNPYDSNYERIEDKELWLRTVSKYKIRSLSTPLMFYREFGVPTLKKYLKTQRNALKIYLSARKYNLSFLDSVKSISSIFIKSIVCISLYLLNQMDVLISLRRRKEILYDKNIAIEDLKKALSVNK